LAAASVRQRRIDDAVSFAEARRKDQSDYDGPAIPDFCERVWREATRREGAYEG